MKNKDTQQFSTGFALGMLVGSVGQYLTSTEEGRQFRAHLFEEWRKAQQKMSESEVNQFEPQNLRSYLKQLVTGASTNSQPKKSSKKKITNKFSTNKPTSKSKKAKKPISKKFKGV